MEASRDTQPADDSQTLNRPFGLERTGIVATFMIVVFSAAFYALSSEVNTLKTLVKEQADEIGSLKRQIKKSEILAFSARVKPSYTNIGPEETIVFSDVVTNSGNAYSGTTGEFTTPVEGLYVFYSHILTAAGRNIEAALSVNGNKMLFVYSGGTSHFHGSGGNFLAIYLQKGDKVKMVNVQYGTRPYYIHHLWSTFSGFLLVSNE